MRIFRHETGTECEFADFASDEIIKKKLSPFKGEWVEISEEESEGE